MPLESVGFSVPFAPQSLRRNCQCSSPRKRASGRRRSASISDHWIFARPMMAFRQAFPDRSIRTLPLARRRNASGHPESSAPSRRPRRLHDSRCSCTRRTAACPWRLPACFPRMDSSAPAQIRSMEIRREDSRRAISSGDCRRHPHMSARSNLNNRSSCALPPRSRRRRSMSRFAFAPPLSRERTRTDSRPSSSTAQDRAAWILSVSRHTADSRPRRRRSEDPCRHRFPHRSPHTAFHPDQCT